MAGSLNDVFAAARRAVATTLGRHLITARDLVKASTLTSSGLWVGFWLDPDAAAVLAVPGGEPPDGLHVTLCYVPDVPPDDARVHAAVLALEVRAHAVEALTGTVTGGGRFDGGTESGARDVLYAVPDVHGLVAFRQALVEALTAVGLPPSREHEFTPHVALRYVDPGSEETINPPPVALRFAALEVRVGDERVATIPLGTPAGSLEKATKPDDPRVQAALDDLDLSDFDGARDALTALLADVATQGMQQGALTIRALTPGAEDFALPNDAIVEWARTHAAELVGKRVLADGTVIDNPNAAYALTDATRELLRGTITQAFEESWSKTELRDALAESYALSPERAQVIARNEISRALIHGNREAVAASGLPILKESLLGSEHDRDDDCDLAADDGPIPLDEQFSNGETEPPYHVNCVCDLAYRVAEGGEVA